MSLNVIIRSDFFFAEMAIHKKDMYWERFIFPMVGKSSKKESYFFHAIIWQQFLLTKSVQIGRMRLLWVIFNHSACPIP